MVISDFFVAITDCIDMLSVMDKHHLRRTIKRIQQEMGSLGRLRPGTLYSRLNVCGRAGCKCGRKRDPVKHGPYDYLSYTFKGKSHTEFVREGTRAEVEEQVRNYERLMALVQALVEANIELSRLERKTK